MQVVWCVTVQGYALLYFCRDALGIALIAIILLNQCQLVKDSDLRRGVKGDSIIRNNISSMGRSGKTCCHACIFTGTAKKMQSKQTGLHPPRKKEYVTSSNSIVTLPCRRSISAFGSVRSVTGDIPDRCVWGSVPFEAGPPCQSGLPPQACAGRFWKYGRPL